jgi:hemerythrin-like metal-binding protein
MGTAAGDPIQWNDQMLTGVGPIDRRNRILFDALGELESKASADGGARACDEIARDLLAYALFHFETEEELMRRCGYDHAEQREADAHLQEHREFSRQLADLCAQWDGGDAASRDAQARLLKQWLSNHIRTSDQRVGRFITLRKSA